MHWLRLSAIFSPQAAVQIASPVSDISAAGWVNESGSGSNLYASLDEATPNPADYAISPIITPGGSSYTLEVLFDALVDPFSSSLHTIRYQYLKRGQATVNLTVRVMQGTTEIASWSHTDIPASATDGTQTLTGPQADSITNYGDLRVRFIVSSP
jgi:hypothetical protein